MDNTTYPYSETDVNENFEHSDIMSIASNGTDFVDRWVNLTVEKEVLRGSQLREEKLKSYPQQNEYEVVSINLVRPVQDAVVDMCHQKKRSPGRPKVKKTASCSPRSNSRYIRIHSSPQAYTPQKIYSRTNSPSLRAKGVLKCPMRIAELAVPTKRQCIDTWRNKCDVLPPLMVERLRQQIMDEKPIVQIKEAISCFKRRKPRSVKSIKRCKPTVRDVKLNNEWMVDLRNFCAVFANKIGQKLIVPQNIKLTPQLGILSNVISAEISKIIQTRQKFNIDVVTNNRIQAEVAAKIAIWIAMVLEDALQKILEDDLRVKKDTHVGKSLNTEKTPDLEEEEGPVLDCIDDIVYNVVSTCEPQELDMDVNDNISETTSKGTQDDRSFASAGSIENEFDTSTPYTNITYYDTGDGTLSKSNEMDPPATTISEGLIQEIDNQSFDQTGLLIIDINDYIQEELHKVIDCVCDTFEKDLHRETDGNLQNERDSVVEHVELLPESPGNSELAHLKRDQSDSDFAVEDVVLRPKNSSEDRIDDFMPDLENVKAEENHNLSAFELLDEKDDNIQAENVKDENQHGGNDENELLYEDNNKNQEEVREEAEESTAENHHDAKDDNELFDEDNKNTKAENVKIVNHHAGNDENKLLNEDDKNNEAESVAENHHSANEENEILDDDDDKNKKVKFSEVEMDVGGHARQLDSNSALQSKGEDGKERVSWHSSTDIHKMVFAPPNDHLLSDADEIWPDDLATPIIKASASASRSVTSLGKILEKDEKLLISEDKIRNTLDWDTTNQTELEIVDQTGDGNNLTCEQSENIQHTSENDAQIGEKTSNESKADTTLVTNSEDIITDETESSANTIKITDIRILNEKTEEDSLKPDPEHLILGSNEETEEANLKLEPDHLILDSITSPTKIKVNDAAPKRYKTEKKDTASMDIKNPNSDTNVIFEAVQQKMRSSYAIPEPKHDYKVHAKTAPSWVRHDHGKGEPSEDSFRIGQCKEKNKETEIRNWCKDLDRILVNLEMWNGWLDNTCKNVMYLKQKKEMNKLFTPNARKDASDWIALKKNIDKDTVLWTKLNQKAYERLKTYKDKTKCLQPEEILNIHDDKKTVIKALQEVDRICLWMHRMIVSTEYCLVCDCKKIQK